jgi:hypothetical protein
MNPLKPLADAPNEPGEPMPCAQVWSSLKPHQRDQIQRIMLRVCCQLANAGPPVSRASALRPTPSGVEVTHE